MILDTVQLLFSNFRQMTVSSPNFCSDQFSNDRLLVQKPSNTAERHRLENPSIAREDEPGREIEALPRSKRSLNYTVIAQDWEIILLSKRKLQHQTSINWKQHNTGEAEASRKIIINNTCPRRDQNPLWPLGTIFCPINWTKYLTCSYLCGEKSLCSMKMKEEMS